MKKFEVKSLLALMLAVLMIFAMTACGGGTDEPDSQPGTTDPAETEPTETDPVETDPAETDPVETDPVETDPVETDPVETDPVETDPVETEPVETDPVETKPVETEPVETDPVETKPVETDPVETEPVETDPVETDPVETDPVETEPVETEPVETEPPHTHSFAKDEVVAATCTAEGYTTYVCECGETKKETMPKTEHSYKQMVISYASCTVDGEVAYSCSYCGTVKSVIEITPATGHTYVDTERDVVSPIYHKGIVGQCFCGETLDVITFTEEHSFTLSAIVADIVSASGDVEYGCEIYTCDCGYTKTVGSNHANGHYFYVDEGSGKYVCDCGEVLVGDLAEVYNGNKNAGVSLLPKN